MPDLPIDSPIIVTASRLPDSVADAPASLTVIDANRIERLGAPLTEDYLRLVPSVSVSSSGPAGSLTDVRIRGSEANHTLLFVEGIRANDPASGNAPRFELLDADLASRIEVVRGPQSALWGSEAIGGVVAVNGPPPGGGALALAEAGSFATVRLAARGATGGAEHGLSLGIAAQRSDGIDSFSGSGDHDGYRNLSGRVTGTLRLTPSLLIGGSGFALQARSEFDGFDPNTFLRADTLDNNRTQMAAGRLFTTLGDRDRTAVTMSGSYLESSNRNYLDRHLGNRTAANRRTLALDAVHHVGRNALAVAVEDERESFTARDNDYLGATNQDRTRGHQSLTVEWKMRDLGPISTDLALRRDIFSRFRDATTLRGSVLAGLGSGVSILASYGTGIAQPTFFDLFGFFPGSFIGNSSLRPESSRAGEVSLRYRDARWSAAVTAYRQRLRDEIVEVFSFPSTTANAVGTSRRQGIEAEASWSPSAVLRLSATYAYLDATEPRGSGGASIREQRRPKHSGSVALDGVAKRLSYGASIAYTGTRIGTDFDQPGAPRLQLRPYWLAGAQFAYRLLPRVDATLRFANAFDKHYQDVIGYRTEGRSVHVGIRLAARR